MEHKKYGMEIFHIFSTNIVENFLFLQGNNK
jgi:hypothetical protein